MGNNRYTAEFKAEAVKQVLERGHGVASRSKRPRTTRSRHSW